MGRVLMSGGRRTAGSDECTAAKGDILKGKTAISSDSDDEVVEGTLELTGNATKDHVLADKTFYSTDAKMKETGGIQSMAGGKKTPTTSEHAVSCAKKYMTSDIVIPAFSMPSANVIKKGTTVKIYDKSVVGTWEGYPAETLVFWDSGKGGNVGKLVGTGSLGFGDLGQIWSGVGDSNYLTTPSAVNLRKYNKLTVSINKTAGRDYGGVSIVALYSNGGSRTLATWRTDSASGQSFTLEYDASLMASLRLKFNYEGTGLWYWALQNS